MEFLAIILVVSIICYTLYRISLDRSRELSHRLSAKYANEQVVKSIELRELEARVKVEEAKHLNTHTGYVMPNPALGGVVDDSYEYARNR